MSLLEYFGDNKSEDIGTIDKSEHANVTELTQAIVIKGIAGFVLLGLAEWGIVASGYPVLWNIVMLAYLAIAYNVNANPRMDRLGLLGGLVDHPFRYTDDINRTMLFLKVVLFPGKIVATFVMDLLKGMHRYIVEMKRR